MKVRTKLENELRRREFWEFCIFYNPTFFTEREFLKEIADGFQQIHTGQIRRLAVSMPPRSGKSYLTSLYSAWLLGNNPEGSVMRNCATGRLYNIFSYHIRKIVRSEKFREIFPGIELSKDKQNLEGWNLQDAKMTSYFGAGVGGQIVGMGATIVAITDDLIRGLEDSMSETIIEKTSDWYDSDHMSRLEKGCPQIDIGTRWSKRDPIGRNIDNDFYDLIINKPALNENDESISEAVNTADYFMERRRTLAPEVWESMYQQNPIEASGTLFKRSEAKRFSMFEMQKKINEGLKPETICACIDVADKGTDKYAHIIGFVFPNQVLIWDVIYSIDTIDITLPRTIEITQRYNVDNTVIEVNNQGGEIVRGFRDKITFGNNFPITNTINKHSRILNNYGFSKDYFYFRQDSEIEKHSEYEKFMSEYFSYVKAGENTKDDANDVGAGLAKFLGTRFRHLFT